MNECYICFENCLSKCKCKCNLYVHDKCIKQYGSIKNFYSNKEDNLYFIYCPICLETVIYNLNNDIIVNKKIKKKKKCCLYF